MQGARGRERERESERKEGKEGERRRRRKRVGNEESAARRDAGREGKKGRWGRSTGRTHWKQDEMMRGKKEDERGMTGRGSKSTQQGEETNTPPTTGDDYGKVTLTSNKKIS